MHRLQRVCSFRPALLVNSRVLPTARFATSSETEQAEPSFTEMCEGFFNNARSYVEDRLLSKPDQPGTRKESPDEKQHKIKGKHASGEVSALLCNGRFHFLKAHAFPHSKTSVLSHLESYSFSCSCSASL